MKKLSSSIRNISQILFLDIETCTKSPKIDQLSERERSFWEKRVSRIKRPGDPDFGSSPEYFYAKRAGIYAEFSKVICISVGFIDVSNESWCINTKSFFDIDEFKLLEKFSAFLDKVTRDGDTTFLAGHNIREFDVPFLCRRMLVANVKLPQPLELSGKKAWECSHLLDTLDLWKFGDYKNYISLDQLCHVLNIPTPKSSLSGDKMHHAFWIEKDYELICKYCESDVFASAIAFIKLKQWYNGQDISHNSRTESNVI